MKPENQLTYILHVIHGNGPSAYTYLVQHGWHPNVILERFDRYTRRGYLEYGFSNRHPWLTPKGYEAIGLEDHRLAPHINEYRITRL